MSKHLYCDNCANYMLQSAPGVVAYRKFFWDEYDFCSGECMVEFIARESGVNLAVLALKVDEKSKVPNGSRA